MIDLNGKKILIVKLRYIGDTLSIVPVVGDLKRNFPSTAVDVMVHRGTEDLVKYHPDIRNVLVYDRSHARLNPISTALYHINLINSLRSEKYDLVIDFTLGDRAAFLSFMTGAPQRITYKDSSTLSHILMNRIIVSDPSIQHIVDYQLESLRYLGINSFEKKMTICIPEAVKEKTDRLLETSGINRSDSLKVVIHPGARGAFRQWRPERFAEIARQLKEKYDAAIILVGGPEEKNIIDKVENSMGFPASFRSNEMQLLDMAALLEKCHLFIGNDSAPGHIAAAVNCPNLTLFGPTFPHMWRPYGNNSAVVFKDLPCCGCRQEECLRPEESCMDLIGTEEVWETVEGMLHALKLK